MGGIHKILVAEPLLSLSNIEIEGILESLGLFVYVGFCRLFCKYNFYKFMQFPV